MQVGRISPVRRDQRSSRSATGIREFGRPYRRFCAACNHAGRTGEGVQINQLADAELARLRDRLPGLSDQQQAETAATVHRILRKIVHQPTVRAKEFSAGPDGPVYLDALRQLFDLRTGRART